MREREPEAWESSAGGPFLTPEREHGTVEAWVLGRARSAVKGWDSERVVAGFDAARETAHALVQRSE